MSDAPEKVHLRFGEKDGFSGLPRLTNCWQNYKDCVEYIRKDVSDALVAAERERCAAIRKDQDNGSE